MAEVFDVAVVGGGPAGLGAAALLARAGRRVVVLEREAEAGGIPRHCAHSPYGMREWGRVVSGPAHARRLVAAARAAGAEVRVLTTVTALRDGPVLEMIGEGGPARIEARQVLLATGARETPRAARLIGGTKPAGVLTTGALQGLVHLGHRRPFRAPVVLGTELVAFSALLTCRAAGIRPVAMVEPGPRTTARRPSGLLPRALGVPLLLRTAVLAVEGRERVEAVVVEGPEGARRIAADGLLVTGQFRPESALARAAGVFIDPLTRGPAIDEFGRTSLPGVFAAGNALRGVETAGVAWAEGRAVAAAMLRDDLPETPGEVVTAGGALEWVLPQRIAGGADPAFPRLQARAAAGRGALTLLSGGRTVGGRRVRALPERRLSLPLPPPGAPTEVVFGEAP